MSFVSLCFGMSKGLRVDVLLLRLGTLVVVADVLIGLFMVPNSWLASEHIIIFFP